MPHRLKNAPKNLKESDSEWYLKKVLNETMKQASLLPKSSLVRMVKTAEFWKLPAEIAMATQEMAARQGRTCAASAAGAAEREWRKKSSPSAIARAELEKAKMTNHSAFAKDGKSLKGASNTYAALKRNPNAIVSNSWKHESIEEAHEECFVVFGPKQEFNV